LFKRRVFALLLSGGLLSAGILSASAVPASATTSYTICTDSETYCLNSPGAGNNVVDLNANYASYTAVYQNTWDGHDVAAQKIGAGPDCLTWNGSTDLIYAAVCNGRASQEFWWNPAIHTMVNEYAGPDDGMCALEPGNDQEVGMMFEPKGAYCVWHSKSGNFP
jgi:hypothetical protein